MSSARLLGQHVLHEVSHLRIVVLLRRLMQVHQQLEIQLQRMAHACQAAVLRTRASYMLPIA